MGPTPAAPRVAEAPEGEGARRVVPAPEDRQEMEGPRERAAPGVAAVRSWMQDPSARALRLAQMLALASSIRAERQSQARALRPFRLTVSRTLGSPTTTVRQAER